MKKLVFALLVLPSFAFAQNIENQKAELQGEKIIITYDIVNAHAGDKFTVSLYSAHNNFSSPVNQVIGDAGEGITEGKGKRIVWDAKSEIGNYKGQLSFDVRALVISPLAFTKMNGSTKRGKIVPLAWRGGTQNENVLIELLQQGTVTTSIGSAANTGAYDWRVPSKQKTGGDYQVRLTNGKEVIISEPFSIKHKTPLILKLLPLAGVAAALSMGGGGSKPSGSSALTGPPDLGLN